MTWWASWLSAELDATIVALLLIATVRLLPRMPAAWRVGLLTIALLKLALPMLPGPTIIPLPSLRTVEIAQTAAPNVTGLALVHLLGAVALLTLVVARGSLVVRRLKRVAVALPLPSLERRFRYLAQQLGMGRCMLRLSPPDVGPLAYGIVRPIVVVPARLVGSLCAEELDAVLMHELMHHARRDLALRFAAAIVTCLWWLNPVAWLLARELRRATEDAADDAALAHLDRDVPRYCAALVRSARFAALPATAPAAGLHPLGRRLLRLTTRGASTPSLGVGGWMLCISAGLLAMSAQSIRMTANVGDDDRIIIRHRIVTSLPTIMDRDLRPTRVHP